MGKYLLSPLSVVVVLLCILAAVLYFKESDTSAGGRGYRGGATPVVTAVATLNETRQTIEAIGTAQRMNQSHECAAKRDCRSPVF